MPNKVDSKKVVLKGLDNKTVVHCQTQDLADKVTSLATKAGLTWINGKSYADGNKWEIRGNKSCYQLSSGLIHTIEYFQSEGFNILNAEEFIRLNSKPKIPNVKLTPEQMEFNLDRLAASSDKVFKDQLTERKKEFVTDADQTALSVLSELKQKVVNIKNDITADFTKEVSDVLVNSKEMLLEELRKGRTTINVNTGEAAVVYSISADDHYMMETVFKSLLLHKKIMMAGEAGKY